MIICDHNMVIRAIDACHPGSSHDSFIWSMSNARQFVMTKYRDGDHNSWLLGDAGYALEPFLLTPYRNPEPREGLFLCLFGVEDGLVSSSRALADVVGKSSSLKSGADTASSPVPKEVDIDMPSTTAYSPEILATVSYASDKVFQDIRSEILLGKKLILSDFVEHIEERKLTQFPEKVYKPARFFHMFGKSLLYRELIDIVARLEPNKSRYDKWIEEAVIVNGLEALVNNVNRKRTKLCSDSAKRIEQYVSGLPVEQRRKAFAQKMTNWALKMKGAGKLEEKMEHFREFLRYEYLETTSMLD
ncbi:uncharacterized protein LOC118743858 [Rhagoletis pomonella]|uniref:uncharacterized protein LOC118743858 n=1 Tax=Rhagoletis pomonella TaxID=28610 RepID=UPI001786F67F|nr:uncharacterized protein LOC118743858 [Rhagoletis pomonella]